MSVSSFSCRGRWFFAAAALLVSMLACLGGAADARAEVAPNAAGLYDTLVLRDLGGRRAALWTMAAANGAFAPAELWKSAAGAFDTRKAKFAAGDVNADGIADGIVLYDLGKACSCLYVFLSDGVRAVRKTVWTSKPGAFAWSKAKLTVGDVNRDGRDDVIVLYDRGRASASLYRFVSGGSTFAKSTGWTTGQGTFSCAKAQLAAGDFTGDGRDDAVVLYKSTTTSSRLFVFATSGSRFVKKTFWRGTYSAGRAKLAAGDADSDGKTDVLCLYRKADDTGRLDVFCSTGSAFKRATWYDGAGGPLPATTCRFAAGDVTGDGRADAVIAQPTGDIVSSLTTCVSTGAAFTPAVWWEGDWPHSMLQLAVSPSTGLVLADGTEVLDQSTMGALRGAAADMSTMAFAGETAQLGRVEPGDVLLAAPSDAFPGGICRKVTGVTEEGGRVEVTTAQATLTDVVDEGEIALSRRITAADLSQKGVVQPGVRLLTGTAPPGMLPGLLHGGAGDGFGFSLSTSIANDTIEVEGEVWLDPDAYVDWDIGPTGVRSASYTQRLTTTTDLSVSLKKTLDKEVKQTIYKQTLAAITIMAGPVPIVVTPEFEVYVGASGEVSAGVTAGMSLTTEASLGIAYRNGSWGKTTSFTKEIAPQPPQLFGSLELRGFAGAGLSFKVYAVAGPEANLEPYLSLAAATNETPWWTLSAGVDAEIGFEVEALDITMLEVTYTFNLFEYVIDQAGSGSGATGGSESYQAPSIRGRVLDAADPTSPVGGAAVEARVGAPPDTAVAATATSAADGTYVLWGLPAGQYTVAASRGGYADNSRSSSVVAGEETTDQDILLSAVEEQGVTGRVVSVPGGAGLDGIFVGLREGSATSWSWPDWDRYTSGGGYFEFVGLEPGPYSIRATDGGIEYYSASATLTVVAGQKTVVPDLELVRRDSQGVSGTVTSALDGSPVQGALVTAYHGWDAPGVDMAVRATTAADGSYVITELDQGRYTLLVTKDGYVDGVRNTTVTRARITPGQDVEIAPYDPDGVARSVDGGDFIRFPAGVRVEGADHALLTEGTYELWFKLRAEVSGVIAQTTFSYSNWPGRTTGNAPTMELVVNNQGKLAFYVNRYDGSGPMEGDWQRMTAPEWDEGEIEAQVGKWYHIAAQFGSGGMKVFVNGKLRQADPLFTGFPAPDWSDGTLGGGWFSLGDNETYWPGGDTTLACFKEVRVSDVQRYSADFTPPGRAVADDHTVLLDHLIGGTVGQNHGFVWVP
ncbi:MAG TPA: carboxypeptidase regulatory-like domain-containing protein [Thermoleophilia bacterium]|nr:carboxypeptidase regulatory-like domain-containing protein [Thermoleophilia bacterium]